MADGPQQGNDDLDPPLSPTNTSTLSAIFHLDSLGILEDDASIGPLLDEDVVIPTNSVTQSLAALPPRKTVGRPGRKGRCQCTPCRRQKRGAECEPTDPSKPLEPPCSNCVHREIPHLCDGPRWPSKREGKAKSNTPKVGTSNIQPRNETAMSLTVSGPSNPQRQGQMVSYDRYHNQRTTVPLRQPETPIYGNLTTVSQCVKCNRSNAPGQDLISILDSITLPLAWQHRVRLAYDIEADLGNRDCYLENLSGQLTNEFSFLRWREADNVVFMFFTVVDLKLPSSRLMCIIHPAATGGERNRHVSTRICVTNIAHLPPLFKNAKRVLGLPSILALCRRKYNPTQSQPQQIAEMVNNVVDMILLGQPEALADLDLQVYYSLLAAFEKEKVISSNGEIFVFTAEFGWDIDQTATDINANIGAL